MRRKISVLDAVIILLLVALVAGMFFRSAIVSLVSGIQKANITITFTADPMQSSFTQYFEEGTEVFDADTGVSLGILSDIRRSLTEVTVQLDDGTYVKDTDPLSSTVVGTLTAEGYVKDGCFYLTNGTPVAAGSVFSAEGRLIVFTMTVTSVEETSDEQLGQLSEPEISK